jgi:hypothetical protein
MGGANSANPNRTAQVNEKYIFIRWLANLANLALTVVASAAEVKFMFTSRCLQLRKLKKKKNDRKIILAISSSVRGRGRRPALKEFGSDKTAANCS